MDIVENDETCFQPKKLQCQCVEVCVRHPLECLHEKASYSSSHRRCSVSAGCGGGGGCGCGCGCDDGCGGGGSSDTTVVDIDIDNVVQSDGYYHDIDLQANFFISNTICEELFQQIIKHYPEQYINLFVDTAKCRLTRIDLSTTETKYPLQDFDLISKLFSHPLREINLSGCRALSSSLSSLKNCASTLQVWLAATLLSIRICLLFWNFYQPYQQYSISSIYINNTGFSF